MTATVVVRERAIDTSKEEAIMKAVHVTLSRYRE